MLDKILLFPYAMVLRKRAEFWRHKSVRSQVPTICVGNITVGGTGKTPHTEMILSMLAQSPVWADKNIAVLSRGYKRRTKGFRQVVTGGCAADFGDEPLQIKKKFPSVTVAVDKNRVEGCDYLANPANFICRKGRGSSADGDFKAADLIILDDAFQYKNLKADLNILLVDYHRPVDTDKLLPFGELRDLPGRIKDADLVIVTKCPYELDDDDRDRWAARLGVERNKVFFTALFYKDIQPVYVGTDIRYSYAKQMIAFSGIANDTMMIQRLSSDHKVVSHLKFPDHHSYVRSDVNRIIAAGKEFPLAGIITTEKDAQRLMDCSIVPDYLRKRMMYIPIVVDFLDDRERSLFSAALDSLRARE